MTRAGSGSEILALGGGYSKESGVSLARGRLLGVEVWLRDPRKGREALKRRKERRSESTGRMNLDRPFSGRHWSSVSSDGPW